MTGTNVTTHSLRVLCVQYTPRIFPAFIFAHGVIMNDSARYFREQIVLLQRGPYHSIRSIPAELLTSRGIARHRQISVRGESCPRRY